MTVEHVTLPEKEALDELFDLLNEHSDSCT